MHKLNLPHATCTYGTALLCKKLVWCEKKNRKSKVETGRRKIWLRGKQEDIPGHENVPTKALGGGSSKQICFAGRKNVLESTIE